MHHNIISSSFYPSRCLICYAEEDVVTIKTETNVSSCEIAKQLYAIFILRKILEIPQETLATFLKEWGSHPDQWIRLCCTCNEVVTKAKFVYEEMLEAERRFRRIQHKILVTLTGSSCLDGDGNKRKLGGKRRRGEKSSLWITDECRAIVSAYRGDRLDTFLLKNPFISGDIKASFLAEVQGDIVVKKERSNIDEVSHFLDEFDGYDGIEEATNNDEELIYEYKDMKKSATQIISNLGYPREKFQEILKETSKSSRFSKDLHLTSKAFLCSVCENKNEMTVMEFLEHYLYHIRYRYKCTNQMCSQRFCSDESKDTQYHFRVHHPTHLQDDPNTRAVLEPLPNVSWWCSVCQDEFSSDHDRDSHSAQIHPDVDPTLEDKRKLYACQFCQHSYTSLYELRLHEVTSHVYDERRQNRMKRCNSRGKRWSAGASRKRQAVKVKVEEAYANKESAENIKVPNFQAEESDFDQENDTDEDWLPPHESQMEERNDDKGDKLDDFSEGSETRGGENNYSKKQFLQLAKQLLSIDKTMKGKLSCSICPDRGEMRLYDFVYHYLYHKRMRYRCVLCNHRFPSTSSQYTAYHYRQHHPEKYEDPRTSRCILDPALPEYKWKCEQCSASFSLENLRNEHLEKMHEDLDILEQRLQCRFCPNSYYSTVEELLIHLAINHVYVIKSTLKCSIVSSEEFHKEIQLLLEREKQEEQDKPEGSKYVPVFGETRHACHVCGRQCRDKFSLRAHLEKDHKTTKQTKRRKDNQGDPESNESSFRKLFLQCPLCKEYKTKNGNGDKICQHLDKCPKRVEWDETGEGDLILHCSICNEYSTNFENKIDLVQHMAWCQGDRGQVQVSQITPPLRSRIFECSLCTNPKKYMKVDAFVDHFLYHMRYRYKCAQCGLMYHSQNNVSNHFLMKHKELLKEFPPTDRFTYDDRLPEINWWCYYCSAKFPNDDSRDAHVISMHANETLPANSLVGRLPPVASLSDRVKKYRCTQCPKGYDFHAELKLHEGTAHSSENTLFSCNLCTATFTRAKLLRKHKLEKHIADRVICDICGMEMLEKSLKQHMETHQEVRSHSCPEPNCGESFVNKQRLKLHRLRKHAPRDHTQNPLVCPHCPEAKAFHNKSYLQTHIQIVHLKMHSAVCDICGKGQQYPSKLRRHLSKVHGIGTSGQYKCTQEGCGKIFYEKGKLISHMSVHRGEPMHKCSYCGKEFYFKTGLKRHELIHANADTKPYQCEICAKRFPVRNYLYIHMKSHRNKGEIQ